MEQDPAKQLGPAVHIIIKNYVLNKLNDFDQF